jgi:retinol dehydrogenase 12
MKAIAMEGTTCVVTGASAGIGFETAILLTEAGARVIGVGRDPRRAAAAEMAIRELTGSDRVSFEVADLSSHAETRALAARIGSRCDAVDVLINNAGLFRSRYEESVDEIEMQFAVNYLAGFLLTREMLPLLREAQGARVIGMSSGSHFAGAFHWTDPGLRGRYFGLTAYDQSKLAVIVFSRELARRLGPASRISTYAVDPGLVKTEIGVKGTGFLTGLVWRLRTRNGIEAEQAAAKVAFVAMDPAAAGRTALYWKDREPVPSSAASYSSENGERLWELSERMCAEPKGRFCGDPRAAATAQPSLSLRRSGSFALR